MDMVSMADQESKAQRRDRHQEIELWWHQLCDEMAFHQQQAEISRLQKAALEPELIVLRDEFFDENYKEKAEHVARTP